MTAEPMKPLAPVTRTTPFAFSLGESESLASSAMRPLLSLSNETFHSANELLLTTCRPLSDWIRLTPEIPSDNVTQVAGSPHITPLHSRFATASYPWKLRSTSPWRKDSTPLFPPNRIQSCPQITPLQPNP